MQRSEAKSLKNVLFSLVFLFSFLVGQPLSAADDQTVELTVRNGDSLEKICNEYLGNQKSWPRIAKLNRLQNPDLIHPGQKLTIPVDLLKGMPMDGKVTFVKGDVQILLSAAAQWTSVRLDESIGQGSLLKTGENSGVEITFKNEDSLLLRSQTSLQITKALEKSASNRAYEFFLDVGRAISRVRNITGGKTRYEVKTPSAVAGARGTQFRVSVDPDTSTRCEVLEGKVGVRAQKAAVLVGEGHGTLVSLNQAPGKPQKLLPPPALKEILLLYRSLPLRFSFENIPDARSYRVLLTKDRESKDIVQDRVVVPGNDLELIGVEDGGYFLLTQSIDKDGLEGLPSESYSVQVRINPLPPFTETPALQKEYHGKNIRCRWLKVGDAAGYHLQVAEDENFSNILLDRPDISSDEYLVEGLDYKTYFFRISSRAADG